MKRLECSAGGLVCDAEVTGETEDEVLEKAVAHAREKHGVDLAASTTLARYARSLIRDENDPPGGGA
jgi:predicted small metal-binding protein